MNLETIELLKGIHKLKTFQKAKICLQNQLLGLILLTNFDYSNDNKQSHNESLCLMNLPILQRE